MDNLNTEMLGRFQIPLPPIPEQNGILDYLSVIREESGALEQTLSRSITLLKERRSALITAAVTGQIDPEEMVA